MGNVPDVDLVVKDLETMGHDAMTWMTSLTDPAPDTQIVVMQQCQAILTSSPRLTLDKVEIRMAIKARTMLDRISHHTHGIDQDARFLQLYQQSEDSEEVQL